MFAQSRARKVLAVRDQGIELFFRREVHLGRLDASQGGKKKSFFHIFSHHFGAHGPRAFGIGICSDTANAPSGHLDGHGCRGIHRKDADRFGRVILGISRTHDASKQLIAHGICLHLKVKE